MSLLEELKLVIMLVIYDVFTNQYYYDTFVKMLIASTIVLS